MTAHHMITDRDPEQGPLTDAATTAPHPHHGLAGHAGPADAPRSCPVCGSFFTPSPRKPDHTYCRERCRATAWRHRRRDAARRDAARRVAELTAQHPATASSTTTTPTSRARPVSHDETNENSTNSDTNGNGNGNGERHHRRRSRVKKKAGKPKLTCELDKPVKLVGNIIVNRACGYTDSQGPRAAPGSVDRRPAAGRPRRGSRRIRGGRGRVAGLHRADRHDARGAAAARTGADPDSATRVVTRIAVGRSVVTRSVWSSR